MSSEHRTRQATGLLNRIARTSAGESALLALDTIRVHKLRSALLILGVGVGVAAMVGMISVLQGLGGYIKSTISASEKPILTLSRRDFLGDDHSDLSFLKRKSIVPEDAFAIRQDCDTVELIDFYQDTSSGTVLTHEGERTQIVFIVGGDVNFPVINAVPVSDGRYFTEHEIIRRRNVVVLGNTMAEDLFPNTDPVGQYLRIAGEEHRIVGVFARRETIFGRLADNFAIIPYTTYLKRGTEEWDEAYVQMTIKDGIPLEDAAAEVEELMRVRRRLKPGEENDFAIVTSAAIQEFTQRITRPIALVLTLISSIGIMVGGIGVMNIMLVSVTERTREIGIRKALGAKRTDVLLQFLIEAATLTGLGGVVGVLGGYTVALLVRAATHFPMAVSPPVILLAVLFSAGIGIFFGLYPANRAARQDPVVALRYE